MTAVTARAHTNIALIKYWGKLDQKLIIPQNSSLSLTLDQFYTDTTVQFSPKLQQDQIQLDEQQLTGPAAERISHFLNLIRQQAHCQQFAYVDSTNHVPTAAGLASSASGFAALAAAASRAAGLRLERPALSRLARRGSGSATRSIYGGFVEWQQGHDDQTSLAIPFSEEVDFDIQMIAIVLNNQQKRVSSRSGMAEVVATSPYYPAWVKAANADLIGMKQAILKKDINLIGQIAESNAMKMHATTLSANPPFTYFEPKSLTAMQVIQNLRQDGYSCYYTMDAGPNIKVICSAKETPAILERLGHFFDQQQLLVAKPGPGVQYL
ncbi:diphosphomevalonate decarboxylase [Loigolactobacillus backii]|uniref:diphosphomevalonate decarboxylase n=1 Tax=Loigolactobacillus backii TaxID=375175 RepID=A0A192H3S7_9LACO|nr:diphosphomevalonate decarboxylase [Loigolactobacillus backii]ANK62908.1 diphosphomevalonate decarboxylase [Loigolactobacillus backii]ANK70084.1 diphosphomevalonate decarboxylase [Loigolactobacillus backii]MDA5387066.1 diphosphomevalonate decarboxylase [Loigolactobacillus backii]MDA5389603.1 diphosphomevalonate decarboxylase [Loigolactobacillus backii]